MAVTRIIYIASTFKICFHMVKRQDSNIMASKGPSYTSDNCLTLRKGTSIHIWWLIRNGVMMQQINLHSSQGIQMQGDNHHVD